MTDFVTWGMLGDFVQLTAITFAVTQFFKNLPLIKKLPTQYFSWIVAFLLILVTNIQSGTFIWLDIILYVLSAMFISTSANGIYDAGNAGVKKINGLINGASEESTKGTK